MLFIYCRPRKRPLSPLIAICSVSFLLGCAAQGPPQPPRVERPERIEDSAVTQVGRTLEITFTLPQLATDGERLTKPLEVEILRSATTPGQKPAPSPAESNPWMTLKPDDLLRYTFGQKIVFTHPPSEQEFNRWVGVTFAFQVRALTRGFRGRPLAGELSAPVETTLLIVSGPVEDFKVTPQEKALELHWSPPRASQAGPSAPSLSGYRIYKSRTGKPGSFQTLAETESAAYSDNDFEFNRTYHFKVRAMFKKDRQVAESDDSQVIEVTPRDIFPPQPPKGLNGIYTTRAVELIWTANTEPDLAGYNVYRREGESPPKRLNSELVRTPIFRDTQGVPGHRYFYSVTAVDLSNNESKPSTELLVETQ